MRLVCPCCGAACAAEAWETDAQARQALRLVSELPESVGRRAIAYLGLFRPASGRGLKWAAALKHLAELQRLCREPHVQWEGRPARPSEPLFWGQGMERLCEQPPKKLPLKSHGYLRAIVYEIAEEADRLAERRRNAAEASGELARRAERSPERVSYEDMVNLRQRKAQRNERDPRDPRETH